MSKISHQKTNNFLPASLMWLFSTVVFTSLVSSRRRSSSSTREMKFKSLPIELIMEIIYHLSFEDLIHWDQSLYGDSQQRRYVEKAVRGLKTVYWKHRRVTSVLELQFIIKKQLLLQYTGENLRNLLKVDLTARCADKRESNLHFAVRTNHPDIVKWLVGSYGLDIDQPDTRGRSPLAMCCLNSCQTTEVVSMARLLIMCGADINKPNSQACSWTPLHYCALRGSLSVAKILLTDPMCEHIIAVEAKDSHGRSALSYACEYGRTDVAKYITDSLIQRNYSDQNTVIEGRLKCFKKSIDAQAVSELAPDFQTIVAADRTTSEVETKAHTNTSHADLDSFYESVGNFPVDSVLTEENSTTNSAWRLLQSLKSLANTTACDSILAAEVSCADLTKSKTGSRCLSITEKVRRREQELMFANEKLSPKRFPPLAPRAVLTELETDEAGYTPLHFAASNGNYEISLLLLSKIAELPAQKNMPPTTDGSLVDIQDARGRSALHLACMHGYTNIAALLASRTSNVDLQDNRGKTPLHFACEMGHISIASLLAIDYDANTRAILSR